MWMHPAHEAFTDSALEPERIYAARERRARAEGVPEDVLSISTPTPARRPTLR